MESEIVFSCPHCDSSLSVEASAAGLNVDCPICSKEITIPDSTPEATPEASLTNSARDGVTEEPSAGNAERNPKLERVEKASAPAHEASSALPEKKEPKQDPQRIKSVLPQKKGADSRDLAEVARGGHAGQVETVRGGFRGYCPDCGDAFLFSEADSRRGAVIDCAKCRSGISIVHGQPPRLNISSKHAPLLQGSDQQLPPGGRDHDLQAAMAGEQITQEQIEAGRDRAMLMSGVRDEWLWLRVGILTLLIFVAIFLLVKLGELRNRGSSSDPAESAAVTGVELQLEDSSFSLSLERRDTQRG